MAETKLTNLINPQVMADMVSEALPKAIIVSAFAAVDRTLAGVPGDTITVPVYAYIGDATDIAEGVAMGTTILTASSTTVTVKKAGKAVELTDEAMLSGYGNPVGNAAGQLTKSIGSKVDQDSIDALTAVTTKVYDGSAAIISYDGVVDAIDLFEEETNSPKVIFVNPKQVTQIRKDADFKDINKYPLGNGVIMTGVIGQIAGCQVVPTRRVPLDATSEYYLCPIVKLGSAVTDTDLPALTIYLKRGVMVETSRDILKGSNTIAANEHYAVSVSNADKVVLAKFKKVA